MKGLQTVYKNGQPYGIRYKGGYLLFFPKVRKYDGQEERYIEEIKETFDLAEKIMNALRECSEIYCMHDQSSAEIFCAFDDKERADLEHEECGAPYQIVKLHNGKRK